MRSQYKWDVTINDTSWNQGLRNMAPRKNWKMNWINKDWYPISNIFDDELELELEVPKD